MNGILFVAVAVVILVCLLKLGMSKAISMIRYDIETFGVYEDGDWRIVGTVQIKTFQDKRGASK